MLKLYCGISAVIRVSEPEGVQPMSTVKIERSGTSQKVPLPKGCQFDTDEVEILRRGDEVVLREKRRNLREAFEILASMPDDFFEDGRQDEPPEVRDSL